MAQVREFVGDELSMKIPVAAYEEFKRKVLSTNFKSEEPLFTHFRKSSTKDFEVCSFHSEANEDIVAVFNMLPPGSFFAEAVPA